MPFDPGQLILVAYPFTDHNAAKLRPALVVSRSQFNKSGDFVAVPLSSRVHPVDDHAWTILDTEPYFAGTKLRCSSSVKWTKLMTISKSIVQRKLGVLPPEVLETLQAKVRSIFC